MKVIYFLVNFKMFCNYTHLLLNKIDDQTKLIVLGMSRITKIEYLLSFFFFNNSETFISCPSQAVRPPHGAPAAACTHFHAGNTPQGAGCTRDTGGVHWYSVRSSSRTLKAGAAVFVKGEGLMVAPMARGVVFISLTNPHDIRHQWFGRIIIYRKIFLIWGWHFEITAPHAFHSIITHQH